MEEGEEEGGAASVAAAAAAAEVSLPSPPSLPPLLSFVPSTG